MADHSVRENHFGGKVISWSSSSKASLQALGFGPGLAYPGEEGAPKRAMTIEIAGRGRFQIALLAAKWRLERGLPIEFEVIPVAHVARVAPVAVKRASRDGRLRPTHLQLVWSANSSP